MATVWFSIGSNINKNENVRFALSQLRNKFGDLILSPVYQTKAVGFIGNDFYNLVGRFESEFSIVQIRKLFDQFEYHTGRIKSGHRFEDRTLDIDILLYDQIQYQDNRICVPHPDVLEYDFILVPLSELIPDYVHPITGRRLIDHRLDLSRNEPLKAVSLSV